MNNRRHAAFRYLSAAALAAAGVLSIIASGGGGGSFEPSSAQGLWVGTTDTDHDIFGVVLDDGTFWFAYTREFFVVPAIIKVTDSFIQGDGSTSGNDFSSSNVRNFNGGGFFNSGDLDASFSAKATLDGTFDYDDFSEVMNTTYDAAYDAAPSLAAIAGTYDGSFVNIPEGARAPAQIVISAAGTLEATVQGCDDFQATIAPHAAGNVYDVSATIDCPTDVPRTVSGVVFFVGQTLYLTAVDSGRGHGYIFTGTLD